MPVTYKDYAPREVAILVKGHLPLPSGSERAMEGDIVTIRSPHNGIGTGERSNFLWLRIEGLDRNDMDRLKDPNAEPLDEEGEFIEPHTKYDKRRFCIPLERLKKVAPWLDLVRVRCEVDNYQPFIQVDEETGNYIGGIRRPLSVHGLVYDKAKQRFL